MTMQRTLSLATALLGWHLLAGAPVLEAADSNDVHMIFGAGTRTCAENQIAGTFGRDTQHWIAGYLSSFNQYNAHAYNNARLWAQGLREYCARNPTMPLGDAAFLYIDSTPPPGSPPGARPRTR